MNGIYVHIPFCAAKCRYCDFNSYAGLSEYRESYISALCKEISEFEFAPGSAADTVYFGGGTPTICTPGELGQALDTIRARTHLDENCEITLECNPGTSDYAAFKIKCLKLSAEFIHLRILRPALQMQGEPDLIMFHLI